MRLLVVLAAASLLGVGSADSGIRSTLKDHEPYGNVVVFDAATGARIARFPIVRGTGVGVPDGTGGFYVAAYSVGEVRIRAGIAHLRGSGALDRRFRVALDGANSPVAVSGRTLYAAGADATLGGGSLPFELHAVNVRNGRLLRWSPVAVRGAPQVGSVAVVAGNVIAAGGGYVSAFDERSAARRWSLRARLSRGAAVVRSLAAIDGRLFVAGAFDRVCRFGQRAWTAVGQSSLVELDPRSGAVKRWRTTRPVGHAIFSIAASRTTLYVGGLNGGYAIGLATGSTRPLPGRPRIVALAGGRLYLGGNVRYPLGLAPGNLAALDLATGRLTMFHPRVTRFQWIGQILVSRNHVLAAGLFAQ
jgi:hypothetical protein